MVLLCNSIQDVTNSGPAAAAGGAALSERVSLQRRVKFSDDHVTEDCDPRATDSADRVTLSRHRHASSLRHDDASPSRRHSDVMTSRDARSRCKRGSWTGSVDDVEQLDRLSVPDNAEENTPAADRSVECPGTVS